MHPILSIAIDAARAAGGTLLKRIDRITLGRHSTATVKDFIDTTHLFLAEAITRVIHRAHPGHEIIIANKAPSKKLSNNCWWVTPLDSDINYLHNYPQIAVSIAFQQRDQLQHAVVMDPLRQEWFTASRGCGALLNWHRIRVSSCRSLKAAIIAYNCATTTTELQERYALTLQRFLPYTAGIRQTGSILLDVAHVASGKLDGLWGYQASQASLAASALLIQEAGGLITVGSDPKSGLDNDEVISGCPRVTQAMLERLRKQRTGFL